MRGKATYFGKTSDSYLELVKRFPLRRIRSGGERDAAARIARELALRGEANLDSGEIDYLETISKFIQEFEQAASVLPKAAPIEILKPLMEQRGMRPIDLGKLIGNSAATMVLSGERELSKAHIRKLAQFFHVNPGLFI